jgi:hypothetical protein
LTTLVFIEHLPFTLALAPVKSQGPFGVRPGVKLQFEVWRC